jgi:hypothetical protein
MPTHLIAGMILVMSGSSWTPARGIVRAIIAGLAASIVLATVLGA